MSQKNGSKAVVSRSFREIGAGGFTRIDGTVEFYSRVRSLLEPGGLVMDYGAGRGSRFSDDFGSYKSKLADLSDLAAGLVAVDLDAAVLEHPTATQKILLEPGGPIPMDDQSIDLVVSDFVFEHVGDPAFVAGELDRVLRPKGWVCARTPNKWSPISIATRLINNVNHGRLLHFAQPERKIEDVFPTTFLMNTMGDLSGLFPPDRFENYTYYYEPEPAYFFSNEHVFRLMQMLSKVTPPMMSTNIFVFLQKF